MSKNQSYIEGARLIDNRFFEICFRQNPAYIGTVINTIFKQLGYPQVTIRSVSVQHQLNDLENHEVRLDLYAEDENKNVINVEVQRATNQDLVRRARYYRSMLDTNMLPKGKTYSDLKDTFVIFIMEDDLMGRKEAAYELLPVFRHVFNEGKFVSGDGTHIIFINGRYRARDPIGRLMSDFFATDAHQIHNKLLSERVKFFKETEEGKREMSGIEQEIEARGILLEKNAVVRKLLLCGDSIEKIAEVSSLPVEEIIAMKEALEKDGQELPRKQQI
jgi:hypothetical protein